ncbi:Primosomal protein N [uncultured Paludibacter sp.]|uniref:Replication restart protein PriA n=1 Tax=uncultured Paludibacter sp. TaxID=497635 RepID=A0A653AEK5_9BACT|nr:Primosomal protein N [uncultured Paludibacter sp.]
MLFIDVILPLPLGNTFTYAVPDEQEENVQIGMRVVVPFGKKKMYTAIVSLIHSHPPTLLYEPKEIICLLDKEPILRYPQLKFWQWISSYYQAYLGDVYQAAIPAGLKLESETQVRINSDFEGDTTLSEKETRILDALSDGKIQSVNELEKNTGINNSLPYLRTLLEKGAVEISEELTEKYRPKTETYVRLTEFAEKENNLRKIFDELAKTPKRLDLLMKFIDLSKCLNPTLKQEVSKKELLEKSGASLSVFQGLVEKNILESYQKEIGRLDFSHTQTKEVFALNEFQQQALSEIHRQFQEKPVVLLHGVTSSGKTEIYIHLIKKALEEKKQVLYLVPEIALTTQLTSRLKRIFGNKLGVYHSKFSDAERVEIWENILQNKGYEVIIGVRSSIFLPFRQLGLIIVDEEHETSYKQFDPSPRYHARNAAIVLASMHNAKTLLGTATPAIETYYNAKTGKYGYVLLEQRFQELELPEILVVNTKEAYHKKEMTGYFSETLLEKTRKALERKEQILLFQNRRGYAPFLECKSCSYIPKCKNCDVSLTVHKYLNKLTCHYCGYTENIPQICPVCHTPNLENRGFGTEKIEDEIKEIFPAVKVARMDTDTTRNKKAHDKIITEFEQGKIDILVGTQMISKGLDFERVSLVGILNADNMLNFPDFRAHERAYQLMTQVSGRSGRKNKRGTVVLQTSNPQHLIVTQVINNDFEGMFKTELIERKQFKYPPFVRLIEITLRHKDVQVLNNASETLAIQMRKLFGSRVLGPNVPPVTRIQNLYIKNILLKLETEISSEQSKNILQQIINEILSRKEFKSVRISLDVDPM